MTGRFQAKMLLDKHLLAKSRDAASCAIRLRVAIHRIAHINCVMAKILG